MYVGGGFPEEHAAALSANEGLRRELATAIGDGLPVWAECGGLMYLSQAVCKGDERYPMVGALPLDVEQMPRPQGHGYVEARVDGDNPFLAEGTSLRGHEFHYSRLGAGGASVATVLNLARGVGVGRGRDGLCAGRLVATYTHLHALGAPEWAPGVVRAAAGAAS